MDKSATFDVIIIGAGTAGSVLANRLTADKSRSVLVLEAGEERSRDPNIYTPGLGVNLLGNDEYDWRFLTEPEPGLNGRRIKHPRGKVIGGSSAINSFALIYPSRADIDAWEQMGSEGWNWNSLQPYFEKFQTVQQPSKDVQTQLNLCHGADAIDRMNGELRSCFPANVDPLLQAWIDSWREVGLLNKHDVLSGDSLGGLTSTCHVSGDRKERSHAGAAFLQPVSHRDHLTIVSNALVDKVILSHDPSQESFKATSVDYLINGAMHTAHAKQAVVLTAGSLSSPAILERSGVGDRDVLSRYGIDTQLHNIAVGTHLQDHIRCGIGFEAGDNVAKRSTLPAEEARKLYERDRSGPLADAPLAFAFSHVPLLPLLSDEQRRTFFQQLDESIDDSQSRFEKDRRMFIKEMLRRNDEASATALLARRAISPDFDEETLKTEWLNIYAMLSRPLSTGTVHITSRSPKDNAKVVCNYFQDPLDLEVLALSLRGLETVAGTKAFKHYLKPGGKRLPSGESMDEMRSFLRQYSTTNYHPTSTCAMHPEGVVDSKLKVHGTANLYVADASIIPVMPRGNIITTVYAVAEKAADILIEALT